MIDDDGLTPISSTCRNCGQEDHYKGIYCWWGVRLMRGFYVFVAVSLIYFVAAALWMTLR